MTVLSICLFLFDVYSVWQDMHSISLQKTIRRLLMRQNEVLDAYEYCRRVTPHASKTFYWGSIFLPLPKRRAIWAVYALCRLLDDIVDEVQRFSCSEGELMEGTVNEAFCELVRFEMARANDYYQRTQPGIALLNTDCQLAVRLSATLYS